MLDVDYNSHDIEKAVRFQISHGKYPSSDLVGSGDAGERMADAIGQM